MEHSMTACPSCGNAVRPLWPSCRSCGTLLMAAPAPVVEIGAVSDATPSVDEQFFAPAVYQAPIKVDQPTIPAYTHNTRVAGSGAGKWIALAGMVFFVFAAIATAWFTIRPSAAAKHPTPVALAPRVPTQGLPTSLDVIVRVEAESTRHTALQAVADVATGDRGALAAAQPDYTWVAGSQPSPDSHTVSVAQNAGNVIIAVAASNHDVCAFGKWAPNATPVYVTMAHEETCAAVDAPATGWSPQAGGAESDLPDDNG
jgi:hypothetical protein